MSEKTCRFFSDTRSVPIADRQSVHGMAVIAGWIELITGHPTSYERPPGSHITSQERYKTTSILAFAVQADAVPRRDGVTAAFRSKTRRLLPLPRPCRPRASHSWAQRPSWSLILTWRMELSQRRSTSPLSTCILMLNRRVRCRNVAGRMPSHHSRSWHPCSAAHTAQQPRRELRAIPTARYGHGYRGGHLGSLQRPYETISVCPSDLLLALGATSAGDTDTVVWGVIRSRKGSRNTCNVKTVPSRST